VPKVTVYAIRQPITSEGWIKAQIVFVFNREDKYCFSFRNEVSLFIGGLMSDDVSDVQKREYLPLIISYLMVQYFYTNDAETQKEIERLKAELAEVNQRLGSE
jgi:hypothetical protein